MEYNIDNAELTATLTAVNLNAAVIGQAPLEVAIGESARIDVGQAINYVKSGAAEIAAAVQEGTAAFDLNVEQKTADFNDNASNKTAEYNQNADNRLSEYNANDVAKTTAYNQNASDKTTAFDNNANDKTDNYNQNAEYKTDIFNLNTITKTMAFDNNAATKAQAFDDNATAKTTAFNDNAAIKQAAVDASADAAAASATTAKQYAIGVPSEPSGYSAKYWAGQTAQSLSGLQSDVAGIKAVIPASATASNKLTDKSYVDTADNNLQSQIDAITASSDVTDIVGTYAELQSYDTSALAPNSIIKVLQDESRNNETTYYRWVITGGVGAWSLIGEEGPYYTISAADAKFATQTDLSTRLAAKQNTLFSGTNIKTINGQSVLGSGDLTVTASTAWGSITGTLSAQTDLQNALNAKANNADLSNYVTLNTNQTISGAKTFADSALTVWAQLPELNLVDSDVQKGTVPSRWNQGSILYKDKDFNDLVAICPRYTPAKETRLEFICYAAQAASNTGYEYMVLYGGTGGQGGDGTLAVPSTYPNGTDNTKDLGKSWARWKQLYAGTTSINTSDERVKQGIEPLPDDVLDAWGEVEFYRYKFNDAVEEKGFAKARYHTGMVAQRIERIFAEHGLNAFDYGLLCYDEWEAEPEEKNESGEIIRPARAAGNRYSLRYEECLCMEAAYQRRRADRIEKRLAALEARL